MLRSVLGAAAAATVASLALAGSAGPAAAVERPGDPLEGLALHPEWGSVTGQGGVLRRSCHHHRYSYSIDPPEGYWALEVYISGPGLQHLAAGAFLGGYDPTTGTGRYTLCRNSTRYGTFTIAAKLSVDDGTGHVTEGRLPADKFRLRRPGR